MFYPKFLKTQDTIGITAPSDGQSDTISLKRLDNAYLKLRDRNYKIIETKNVRNSHNGRSSSAIERAKELEELFQNKEVSLIISASGGDFLMEILPYLNLNIIKENPKWYQGYSDNTILTYIITTNLDIATIYGNNISAFGMTNYHKSLEDNLSILSGNIITQNSYSMYQNNFQTYLTGLEDYELDTKVYWKNLFKEKSISMEGRLIGGCLDVLINILGTKYDKTINFIEKYKDDGLIWYLENCELSNEQIIKSLWQLKEANWFKYIKGLIFGRTLTNKSIYGISYEQSLKTILKDLNIPVIIEADFGHKSPRMTIINGAYTIINSENGKGSIKYILK